METQTINLDPIVGPVITSKELFEVSRKAVEESMEYQEFVQTLNKNILATAQSGRFFLNVDVPVHWHLVLFINYRKNGIDVHLDSIEDEHYKARIAWANG